MSARVVDYAVVSEHDQHGLVSAVNELIKAGFEPIGGIAVVAPVLNGDTVAPLFVQALVKKSEEN